jgi:hypothetical protein
MAQEESGSINRQSEEFNSEDKVTKDQLRVIKQLLPDPQVKATRSNKRLLTKAYKLQILNAYEACKDGSERGALLRREGLYHSHIGAWKKKFELTNDRNKGKSKVRTEHLIKEVEQLKKKLAQAEAIIDLQKKVSELLGTHILPLESNGVKS